MNTMNTWIKKSNWMYGGILLSWVFCVIYFNPKLFSILNSADSFIAKIFFSIFIVFLNFFWFYGIYHCFFLFYRLSSKRHLLPHKISPVKSVAILYTTKNDFQEKAALSCIHQSYPDYHLFILDDSSDHTYKEIIDRFNRIHPEKTTIVRRNGRKGFKAGNLNNALKNHVTEHEYFAVVDADEVLPSDFLKKLVPYFEMDENIAFVQANHQQNPEQPSKFAKDLALGINFHWDVYQPPRNNHGFVIFYGHGAVIRRDVWEKVGGFPEIVSEDLAFATRIRQIGYKGYFAREVICYEDFPETYHQFRTRHEKWVKGACEYLHREALPFFMSKRVTWPEKLDVLFSCISLFIPFIFLFYVLIANAILPMLLAEKHMLSVNLLGKSFDLMPAYFMEPRFKELWTLDFYLITIISMFSPIFCYLEKMYSHPGKIIKLLFKSAVPYIALIFVSTIGVLTYLFTGKAGFHATGDRSEDTVVSADHKTNGFWGRLNSNHPLIFNFEWLLGLILTYFSLKTLNFALLTISSCLVLSPLISRYGWESRLVSPLVSLPLFFVLLAIGSMGMGFMGVQGFSLFLFSLHF